MGFGCFLFIFWHLYLHSSIQSCSLYVCRDVMMAQQFYFFIDVGVDVVRKKKRSDIVFVRWLISDFFFFVCACALLTYIPGTAVHIWYIRGIYKVSYVFFFCIFFLHDVLRIVLYVRVAEERERRFLLGWKNARFFSFFIFFGCLVCLSVLSCPQGRTIELLPPLGRTLVPVICVVFSFWGSFWGAFQSPDMHACMHICRLCWWLEF